MTNVQMVGFLVAWCGATIAYAQLLLRNAEFRRGGAWLTIGAAEGANGVDLTVGNGGADTAIDMRISLSGAADGTTFGLWHDALGSGKEVSLSTSFRSEGLSVTIDFRDRMGKGYRSTRSFVRDGAGVHRLIDGSNMTGRGLRSNPKERIPRTA